VKAIERVPLWALVPAVVAVIAVVLVALAALGSTSLPERTGPPVEALTVERTLFEPGTIEVVVRNTGPDPVTVAQVVVNDVFVDFTGGGMPIERLRTDTLALRFPWISGQPYTVSMMTSTGLVIEHEIPAAVATPTGGPGLFGPMVLLGAYVGVVPVLLGMLALPVLRRVRRGAVRVLLAVTVGLLLFLAADALLEGFELAGRAGGAFGGAAIVLLGAALAFLVLTALDRRLGGDATGVRLATMIAVGIGMHNLGEGLVVGSAYAVGELALGTALVVGFAVHNTTEGIAIVAPLADRRPSMWALLGLGLLAGAPAILGAALGATVDNATLSALLFGVGVGAVTQVVIQILPALRDDATGRLLGPGVLGGLGAGIVVMYATGLLVAA
jgi:zinc transporter, ZIP family